MEAQLRTKAREARAEEEAQERQAEARHKKDMKRLHDLRTKAKIVDNKEKEEKKEREEMEMERLKRAADHKEYEEIIRRYQEEARMKYLEGIQLKKELRNAAKNKNNLQSLKQRQEIVEVEKEHMVQRVRNGNFMYHQGKLGFYDEVRANEVPYIEYADGNGQPYYYDPILNKTQFKQPNAPIIHHTEKEREEYDRAHGAGAYSELMREQEFDRQCERDGGHFDDYTGNWISYKPKRADDSDIIMMTKLLRRMQFDDDISIPSKK